VVTIGDNWETLEANNKYHKLCDICCLFSLASWFNWLFSGQRIVRHDAMRYCEILLLWPAKPTFTKLPKGDMPSWKQNLILSAAADKMQ